MVCVCQSEAASRSWRRAYSDCLIVVPAPFSPRGLGGLEGGHVPPVFWTLLAEEVLSGGLFVPAFLYVVRCRFRYLKNARSADERMGLRRCECWGDRG